MVKMMLTVCFIVAASLHLGSTINIGVMKIGSETVHKMRIIDESYRELKKDVEFFNNSTCSCVNYTCGCCLQLVVEKISLNETGCMNISYLPDEYGFQFVFTLNGKVIITEKISVKNPPPICTPIPYAHDLASLCIRFYNLDYKDKQFSGCADIEALLEGVVIKKYDLGCFHIPPSQRNLLIGKTATSP